MIPNAKPTSNTASLGAIFAALTWFLMVPVLVAPPRSQEFLLFVVVTWMGLLAIVICCVGLVECLIRRRPGAQRAIVGCVSILVLFLLLSQSVATVRDAPARIKSANNLKQIALALHNYDSQHSRLPSNSRDRDGKPLLSWRVAILPYIEEDRLFREFHFDEPWDSPHNSALLPRMPSQFKSVGLQPPEPHMTFYRGFTGPGTAFERDGLTLAKDFPHGTDKTILVIEAGDAVPWSKPDDLEFDADKPLPPLGGIFRSTTWLDRRRGKADGMCVAFADGHVEFLRRNELNEAELRRWIAGRLSR